MLNSRGASEAILHDYLQQQGGDTSLAPLALESFVFDWRAAVLVGECGLTSKGDAIDSSRYLSWLQLGLAFLRANFPVPLGCCLGLTWFKYIGPPFPVIALVWSDGDKPEGVDEAAKRMEKALEAFNLIIDWQGLSALLDQGR